MPKRQEFVQLEISGEDLDRFVENLAGRLIVEFWPKIDDPVKLAGIKNRLKSSISDSLCKSGVTK